MTYSQQTFAIILIAVCLCSFVWLAFDIAYTWIMRKRKDGEKP